MHRGHGCIDGDGHDDPLRINEGKVFADPRIDRTPDARWRDLDDLSILLLGRRTLEGLLMGVGPHGSLCGQVAPDSEYAHGPEPR